MADAEVIIPRQFALGEDRLKELRDSGLLTGEPSAIDDMPLKEPQYGETVLGTLEPDDCALYVAFFNSKEEMDRLNAKVAGGVLARAGKRLEQEGFAAKLPDGDDVDEVNAVKYHEALRRTEMLKSLLFYRLEKRFECFGYVTGVRTKRRFVKGSRKW